MPIDHMSEPELYGQLEDLRQQYEALRGLDLSLDLTRGKPNKEQLALSDALDGILAGDYLASNGTDTRNYAGLRGWKRPGSFSRRYWIRRLTSLT